jgi:hypothetical protein
MGGKAAFAHCVVSSSGSTWSWSVDEVYFTSAEVFDSEAGLKRCARIDGKWSTVDRNDPAVRLQMLQQHSRQAQDALQGMQR